VPKSSIAMPTPRLRPRPAPRARPRAFDDHALGDFQSMSVGSMPISRIRRAARHELDRESWFAETFTAMESGRPGDCQAFACCRASRSAHSPIGMMSPDSRRP